MQEAKKLEQIQQDLARIDGSLNTDVRFLRDSIEQASLGRCSIFRLEHNSHHGRYRHQ